MDSQAPLKKRDTAYANCDKAGTGTFGVFQEIACLSGGNGAQTYSNWATPHPGFACQS